MQSTDRFFQVNQFAIMKLQDFFSLFLVCIFTCLGVYGVDEELQVIRWEEQREPPRPG